MKRQEGASGRAARKDKDMQACEKGNRLATRLDWRALERKPDVTSGFVGAGVLTSRRRPQAQAPGTRPVQHPFQCDVGEAGIGIPAADIGVDAGEPDLLDRLVIGLDVLAPHVGRELLALLVNGDRVVGVLHIVVQR